MECLLLKSPTIKKAKPISCITQRKSKGVTVLVREK